MVTSRKYRHIIASSLVLLIFTMQLQAQGPENDQLLKNIPEGALLCVRINNFNNSLTQMDQFLTGVSPVGVSMLVQAQLTNMLGSQQLAGLDMNGSFAAFATVLNSQVAQPDAMPDIFIGVLAPVTDYKQFIDGISSKTPVDSNGIVKVLSLGNPIILLSQCGNYALATWSGGYNNLLKFKKLMNGGAGAYANNATLANVLDASQAKQAASEPFWIYANIQQASKSFEPIISSTMQSIKASLSNIPNTSTGISDSSLQNIMNMYVSIIDTILKEVNSVSLSINPTPVALNMTKMVTTVPGTEMAKMFASNTSAQQNNLLPYLEDGAMMNFAFLMNSPLLKEAVNLQVNLLAIMSGKSANSDDLQKMKSIAESMIDCVKGPAAYTFSADNQIKPPFKGNYIIAVKDENKFRQLINDSTEMMKTMGIMDLYKSMGMDVDFTINQNVETYKGISIDSAKLVMKFTDANTPQAQMLKDMYGSGFDYRWGIVNGLFACTIGSDAGTTMHKLIDKIQAGGTMQLAPEIKTALTLVPEAEKSDFFITMNLLRLFKLGVSMVPSVATLPITNVDIQTGSNLVIDGKANNGTMTVHIALPKEHLQEIMKTIMAIQQKMTQSQNTPSSAM